VARKRKSGKRSLEVHIKTWGIYSQWDRDSKELPKILERTTEVEAVIDIEFGMVVNIIGAKNMPLDFCIDHPGIRDDKGKVRRPFDGTVFVKTNDWDFYLGDTIWNPIEDKLGTWRMTLELDGELVAEKSFEVVRSR
jgi:hypothetical protein